MSRLSISIAIWIVLYLNLNALGQEQARKWPYEFRSKNYIIHSDFQLENHLLNRELDEVSTDVATLLDVPPPSQPIHIVLFRTEREYTRYMGAYFPRLPKRRALFIQDRGPGMLFTHWHADVGVDLRHEMTHALINNHNPLPLWLDEGLAEYFELDRESRIAPLKRSIEVLKNLKKGTVTTIDALSKSDSLEDFDDHDYLTSWAWIHFMMHRNVRTRGLLVRHLRELRAGNMLGTRPPDGRPADPSTPASVFSLHRALTQLFPDVRSEFLQHFQSLYDASQKMAASEATITASYRK